MPIDHKPSHTGRGGTLTADGFIPHFVDPMGVSHPVKLLVNTIEQEGGWAQEVVKVRETSLPLPKRWPDGRPVYACPGGGEI